MFNTNFTTKRFETTTTWRVEARFEKEKRKT